jgi:AcrR family transcriptional regulator
MQTQKTQPHGARLNNGKAFLGRVLQVLRTSRKPRRRIVMTMDAVENKIITAAIECVEQFGLKGATNRRIAEKAGVNLAAINYYFRSKENLVDKVMETTLNNAFDWQDIEKLPGQTAKERCAAIFEDLIKGACDYPGITRAHFYDLITDGNYDSQVVKKYSEFMVNLSADLIQRGVNLKKDQLALACSQIASACFMVIIAPRLNVQALDIDLHDPQTRHRFVFDLVDKLL